MHTSSIIGFSAGILMVATAGINVWLMLESSRSSHDATSRARLVHNHRLLGYIFLAVFTVMFFYMSSRVLGATDGLSTPIVAHITLTLLMVPLLFLKIVIARSFKQHSALLLPLGLAIFVLSFLLVTIAAFPELLGALAMGKTTITISIAVIATALVTYGRLFLRPGGMNSSAAVTRIETGGRTGASRNIRPDVRIPSDNSIVLLLASIEAQTHDTKTLRFIVPPHQTIAARPGQFMTFRWLIDGKPVTRCYTICSSPLQSTYIEITPKKAANGCVSAYLNERAEIGLAVEAKGPFGQFYFDESIHQEIVLIAGGSGITPMISMLRYIDDHSLVTKATLLYFVRTPQDIIFAKELERLQGSIDNFKCMIVVGKADETWQGPVGHINDDLLKNTVKNFSSSTFFICGPPPMMENARKIIRLLGVPDIRIRQESFGSQPAAPYLQAFPVVEGTVEFALSRKACPIVNGRSLLEIAEANDVFIPSSCRQGQCGTCATRLLSGTVRMDCEDGLLPEQKRAGYILTCVSRAQESVKLDA